MRDYQKDFFKYLNENMVAEGKVVLQACNSPKVAIKISNVMPRREVYGTMEKISVGMSFDDYISKWIGKGRDSPIAKMVKYVNGRRVNKAGHRYGTYYEVHVTNEMTIDEFKFVPEASK